MFYGKKIKTAIIEGLNNYFDTQCSKHGVDKSVVKVFDKVNKKNKKFVQQNIFKIS